MAIKMVREPSETPNINNIDDIIPMRYAYGNQNGYVIGKGTEISNTVNGLNFTVNSGRLVLQGVECDIDASGVTITIDNIATKRYYTVYLEVNLGLNTATIKSEYDTATYPTIDAGDDLTENTTSIARLPLYRFIATSGVISSVNKVVESVKYIDESFIKNVKVNDASKVNNLEITKDEKGVLKIGDTIIPQKKLLWQGNASNENSEEYYDIQLSESVTVGDVLEIYWYYQNVQDDFDCIKYKTVISLHCNGSHTSTGRPFLFANYIQPLYYNEVEGSGPPRVSGVKIWAPYIEPTKAAFDNDYENDEIRFYFTKIVDLMADGNAVKESNSAARNMFVYAVYKVLDDCWWEYNPTM